MEAETILCDIDIGILGADAPIYDQYAQGIRREYHFVSEEEYCEGRSRVLENFLRRDSMYQTPHYRALYEETSRENLQRELQQLQG